MTPTNISLLLTDKRMEQILDKKMLATYPAGSAAQINEYLQTENHKKCCISIRLDIENTLDEGIFR